MNPSFPPSVLFAFNVRLSFFWEESEIIRSPQTTSNSELSSFFPGHIPLYIVYWN